MKGLHRASWIVLDIAFQDAQNAEQAGKGDSFWFKGVEL